MRTSTLLLGILMLAVAPAGHAEEAKIRPLDAIARQGFVSVRFQLQNVFEDREIEKALQSGLATGFTFHVELIRKRPNWFDDRIDKARIEIICNYNSVTQEYLLNYRRDRKLVRSEVFHDLDALKQAMTRVDEPNLFALRGYRPRKLVVRARADVTQGYFLYVMPWQITTDWKQVRVRGDGR